MKVDIHTNLGVFPTSKDSSTNIEASIEQTAQFLYNNSITVNFCLYPRDRYDLLKRLSEITPGIEHIGVQVLMGQNAEDATDIETLELDVNNPQRSFTNGGLCYGIKVASHRGWWRRRGIVNSGFDYGNGDGRLLLKWLKQIPDNSICSFHTQGDPINNLAAIPTIIGKYAYKFPTKKFIINHAGDFGQGGLSTKPKKYLTVMKSGEMSLYPAYRYAHSQGLIASAVYIANTMHNVMLDTSIHTPFKGNMMKDCKRWAIGSDYPFMLKTDEQKKTSKLFLNEERKFINAIGKELVDNAHKNAYKWLKEDVNTLMIDNEWYSK
jgi:hypothetical protein